MVLIRSVFSEDVVRELTAKDTLGSSWVKEMFCIVKMVLLQEDAILTTEYICYGLDFIKMYTLCSIQIIPQ